MNRDRIVAGGVAAGLLVAAALLVVERGGLLAWTGVVLGPLLLLKAALRPAPRDVILSIVLLGIWAASWGIAWSYVRSTWESGEVVQLEIAGEHVARVWVIDTSDGAVMYYDAPPDVATSLLGGARLSVTRDGQVTHACAAAKPVDRMREDELQALFDRMLEKYEGRNTATDVYYVVLGVERDRVGLVIRPTPCA